MNLELLSQLTERLRSESIGDPQWVLEKQTFEYLDQTVEVAAILKIVRATQGVHALDSLCRSGLFVDMGAIFRCVNDAVSETFFLLEEYPEKSSTVDKFLREFFSKTIDEFLTSKEHPVKMEKIQNAVVRSLKNGQHDEETKQMLTTIYKTFCGYTHAGYAHIMQMFGGDHSSRSFNVSGVPSQQQVDMHMQFVDQAYKSVIYAIVMISQKLDLKSIYDDAIKMC